MPLQEITFNIPENEGERLLQMKNEQRGPFEKPERSLPFPGFIEARRRNPFELLMRNPKMDAGEPVVLIVQVDKDGIEGSEDIIISQDVLL